MTESRRRDRGPALTTYGGRMRGPWLSRVSLAASVALFSTPIYAPASTFLGSGLQLIERNYLFASELDAHRLLDSALSYAAARVPEVRVLDAEGGAELLVAGPCRLRVEIQPGAALRDLQPALENAATLIERCTTDRPQGLPSAEALLLNGVLSGLDPYSTVFDAEGKEEHAIQFQGTLAGIGARIGLRKEKLTLISVYSGSPANQAGLRDGDTVLRIDGLSTTNLPVNEAVQKIRGEAGTIVRLDIERAGTSGSFPVEVTRALVIIPSVEAKRLDNGVVYAAISHFSQTTPADFRTHVAQLVDKGGAAGVIIDLRSNSGGSMLGSAAIGDMFLDDGILITTAGRNGAQVSGLTPEIRATRETPFRNLAVAILTSPRTASGSELLAGSLRTRDRAVLIGQPTFGKGTVQKTYGLGRDSSLKITVGHFLPNGFAIPGAGLSPDVELRTFVFDESVVWPPAGRGAEKLPFWLTTPPWLRPASGAARAVLTYAETAKGDDEESTGADDPVVALSAEMLARYGSTSADRMLSSASEWLAEKSSQTDAAFSAFLSERGVDWRRPTDAQTEPSSDLDVRIEAAQGPLSAGSEPDVAVIVENRGSAPFFRLYGRLASRAHFLNGKGVLLGYLPPGETRSWHFKVKVPASLRTSRFPVRLELFGERGLLTESGPMYVATVAAARPRLSHRVTVSPTVDPAILNVTIEVRNIGEGPAENIRTFIEHPQSDALELVTSSATAEHLAPGESCSLALQAKLLKSAMQPLQVKLAVSESRTGAFYEAAVNLTGELQRPSWQAAPDIQLRWLVPDSEHGRYTLIGEAVDDDGLTSLWSRMDGKKVEYIDARDDPRRDIEFEVPWLPSDKGQRVEIVAIDREGLRTTYVADL